LAQANLARTILSPGLVDVQMDSQVMMRPCVAQGQPPRRGKRLPLLAGLGVAAAALWRGQETFAGGMFAHRPAGGVIVVDELPSGVACRAYGDQDPERPEWLPLARWQGEKSFRPSREMEADEHRQWWHFNAEGKQLSKLSTKIARVLRGVDNPLQYPGADLGGFVIVTNCEKVRVPGKRYHYKLYIRNLSKRPGHCKVERFKDLQQRFPERIIMRSVWGSLPKKPGMRRIFKERLKLFTGPNHCYYDQNPIEYPMWMIPDCTWETNLRYKDRLAKWIKSKGEKFIKIAKEKEEAARQRQLDEFKGFLTNQLQEVGEENAKDMDVKEFVSTLERQKAAQVREQTEGQEPPKKKIKYYPNTRIPVQKVKTNNRHRNFKWLVNNFR